MPESIEDPNPARELRRASDRAAALVTLMNHRELMERTRQREEIERRDRLIKWFALGWADNDPLFPRETVGNQELTTKAELEATWFEVVRGKVPCPYCDGRGVMVRGDMGAERCGGCDGARFVLKVLGVTDDQEEQTPGTDPGATTER